jgi:hypothetical protein
MSDVLTLNVYLQNNDYVRQLEYDLAQSNKERDEWQRKFRDLDFKVAGIQKVNIELNDFIRAHGLRYRSSADIRNW